MLLALLLSSCTEATRDTTVTLPSTPALTPAPSSAPAGSRPFDLILLTPGPGASSVVATTIPVLTPAATDSPDGQIILATIPPNPATAGPTPGPALTSPAISHPSPTAAVALPPGQAIFIFDTSLSTTEHHQIKLGIE